MVLLFSYEYLLFVWHESMNKSAKWFNLEKEINGLISFDSIFACRKKMSPFEHEAESKKRFESRSL